MTDRTDNWTALHVPDLPEDVDALSAALAYAAAGWFVLPVLRAQKHPGSVVGRDWPRLSSRDPRQIAAWWTGEDHGIALHVGRSGAVVFDVDRPDMVPEALALAIWGEPAPPFQTTRVGAGGRGHYVFTMPIGRSLGNGGGELGKAWGEVRGRNGVIIVAPSVHEDAAAGGRYRWGPTGPVPVLPVELAALLPDGEESVASELAPEQARAWLGQCRKGAACRPVLAVLEGLRWSEGGRHEVALAASRTLAAYGGEGHRGAGGALLALGGEFAGAVGAERARAEWPRMLAGAVALARRDHPVPDQQCSCDVFEVPADWLNSQEKLEVAEPARPAGNPLIERMLTPEQMRALPPPRPLVNGVLDLDSLAWLIAEPGSYKSFVALSLAAHVGLGREWMGRRVHQGLVVYLVAEGVGGMGLRVKAWEKQHGEMKDVLFLPIPVQAGRPEQWDVLVDAVTRLQPVLVVLDTQARVTVGMKENDNTEMGLFIEQAERLRRAAGGCVLVVHHVGRGGDNARGASAIDGAQGTELRLRRTADLRVTLGMDKQKDMADTSEIALELVRVDGGVDAETGRDLSSLAVVESFGLVKAVVPDYLANLTENQALVIGVVRDIFTEGGVTQAQAWAEVQKRHRGGDGKTMPKSSFYKAWDSMAGAGKHLLRIAGTQRYRFVSIEEEGQTSTNVGPSGVD